ncbi:hypothetical protein KCU67_g10482, partial [Aureobasidium melanogenum]
MHFLYLLNVMVLLSFSNVVSSSPVAQGTTSKCNARDIAIVKRTANEPTYFCSWWNSDTRTRTPFMELTVSQVTNACKCISKSSKNKRAATVDCPVLSKGQSVESCSVVMSKQFTEPWHFCKFYTAYPRTTSPFRKYSAKSLLVLCDCVEEKSISSTTKKSSTKKTPVTKTTLKSSSTKSSSSKKATSSSSKKVTSSSKKSSLSSSSSKGLPLSSNHKTTLSSAKSTKTSSILKPISTSKSSMSSPRKTTSSSKMVSSTKRISSSTKAKTLSSASRSSISKSFTSTSIKPSSSIKSSSKILSSSQPSVHTTSSSKSSSKLLSSSKFSTRVTTSSSISPTFSSTIKVSSTSASSATAANTPTARTDGLFYLRVANTTAPLNNCYVSAGETYWLEPSRRTLFSIDSNGYLYRVNGLDADYVVIYDDGYIHNYGAFGQYHAGNPRCSYDENYLLSCAITSVDGTLVPVTFSYNEYSDWLGLYAPSGIPTMNLYVEFAVSSTPSTTSSSGSTTLFTTLSTAVNTASPTTYFNTSSSLNISSTVSPIALSTAAYNVSSNASTTTSATASPTVASICTLVPHLPNGGFEDGTNQTAWSGRDESLSSWAPTTTKPFDGTLSGQFTFRSG